MDKEKLKELTKEIDELDDKVKLKSIQIVNSPEYKQINGIQKGLSEKLSEKRKEERILKEPIYKKYASNVRKDFFGKWVFKTNNIKSSVKQGIKKGLGVTSIALINEYDLHDIVTQLINKDLKKTKANKLDLEIENIDTKIQKCRCDKEKLINGLLNPLKKKKERIFNELNSQKRIIEEKKRKLRKEVAQNLPKFMNKITKEIDRRVILEGLR